MLRLEYCNYKGRLKSELDLSQVSVWVSQTITSQPLHHGFLRSQASWDQRWSESSPGTYISCLTPLYTYVPSRQTSSCTWMLLMMEASLSQMKHLLFLEGTSLDPLSFIQQISAEDFRDSHSSSLQKLKEEWLLRFALFNHQDPFFR